jgi:hypothetical protein
MNVYFIQFMVSTLSHSNLSKCVGWPLSQTKQYWAGLTVGCPFVHAHCLLPDWFLANENFFQPVCQPITSVLMERNWMHFYWLLTLPYTQKASNAFVTSRTSDNKTQNSQKYTAIFHLLWFLHPILIWILVILNSVRHYSIELQTDTFYFTPCNSTRSKDGQSVITVHTGH